MNTKTRPPAASKPRSRSRRDTYWILDEDQIQCLASARRQSIVDRLCADGASSVREFSRAIGMKPSAAYHHLKQLIDVGLVEEAGSQTVGRKVEKLYQTIAPRMRLARALSDPELADPVRNVGAALCRQLGRDFGAGIDHPQARGSGKTRNLGFLRMVGPADAATLEKVNHHLAEIAELLWEQPQQGKPLISFGWTMAPMPASSPKD